jgi:hypothetical protein
VRDAESSSRHKQASFTNPAGENRFRIFLSDEARIFDGYSP